MPLLNEQEIKEIAEKVFKSEKIHVLNYDISPKSQQIIGHLGNHLTLSINVSVRGNKEEKMLFVKTYTVKPNDDDFIGKTGIFQKEVDTYNVLIKDIKNFVGEPDWCPKYYYNKERVLILEDLSQKNFKMAYNNLNLNKSHLETTLQTLSSMHASSLVLEYRKSDFLNSMYPSIFKEILYDENKLEAPSRKWIGWQIQDLLLGIEYLDEYSLNEKKIIKDHFAEEIMQIYSLSKPSEKYRNVFTHGDMWGNNLLFLYCGSDPIDCKFVDFQFSRYAPPAHDVMHVLHYATKKNIRDKEEMHFLRFYYENLSKRLKSYDLDIKKELTWEQFFNSCKEYKELALIQSLLSLHYLLGPVTLQYETQTYEKYEDFLSANRSDYMRKFFQMDSYTDKIKDMLRELIDNYIIKKN